MISAFNIKRNTELKFMSNAGLYFLHRNLSFTIVSLKIQYLIQKIFDSYKKVLTKVVV